MLGAGAGGASSGREEAMMNKPAPKEPSMDEILSSIRQIIADDDAAAAPRRAEASTPLSAVPSFAASAMSPAAAIDPVPVAATFADPEPAPAPVLEEDAPLTLSADQILAEESADDEDDTELDFASLAAEVSGAPEVAESAAVEAVEGVKAEFIDPDDIAFDLDPHPAPVATTPPPRPIPVAEPVRPRPTAAQAAPMPDPDLSSDIAEELLAPTTNAAVRANFARLSSIGVGTPGLTVEAMMREMLKPLLKEWLDEHLPTVVERMVEKEIARISRGVE